MSTGSVTFAARDSDFDNHSIKEGEILALENGKLMFTDTDIHHAAVKLAKEHDQFPPHLGPGGRVHHPHVWRGDDRGRRRGRPGCHHRQGGRQRGHHPGRRGDSRCITTSFPSNKGPVRPKNRRGEPMRAPCGAAGPPCLRKGGGFRACPARSGWRAYSTPASRNENARASQSIRACTP